VLDITYFDKLPQVSSPLKKLRPIARRKCSFYDHQLLLLRAIHTVNLNMITSRL